MERHEYWKRVDSITLDVVKRMGEDESQDIYDIVHEEVDGTDLVIYTHYFLDIIRYSDNAYYYIDNFGEDDAIRVLKDKGLDGLHGAIAFFALVQDVMESAQLKIEEVSK